MKLHKIQIKDFRQFKDFNEIDLAVDSAKNVTVIYGENGRGKTGIFRALMFCLYGDRSLSQDELTGEEKKEGLGLINEVKLKEKIGDSVESEVSVIFSHKKNEYCLSRKISGMMKTDGRIIQDHGEKVELQLTEEDGNTKPVENDPDKVRWIIQEILNSRLRDYFLFDGERIERLTRNTKERRAEVRQGIRALLDLDTMELAQKGLNKLILQIEKEIRYKSTGQLQQVTSAIDDLNTKIESYENEQESDEKEQKRLQHRIHIISGQISENKETAEKEKKRQEFISIRNDKDIELGELQKRMAANLNKSSQLISYELVEQLREELDLRRHKGELPPSIRKEFVEALLENEICICGTSLDKDHAQERNALQDFLQKYYSPGLGPESLDLLGTLNRLSGANEGLINEFNRLLTTNKKIKDEIEDLDSKIKYLGDELGVGGTSIDDLIQERKKCEEDLESLNRKMDLRIYEVEKTIKERDELRKKAIVLEKQQSHVKSLVDRRDLTKETFLALKSIYDRFADEVKEKLATKSTQIFSRLADIETQKDIKKISIDENYMLDVLNWADQHRLGEISAGQRQVVSLSFIMALINVAGDLEVPLFMDTPFGRLSGAHRDHLLETIPKMASQWILLATDTEFTVVEAESLKKSNSWGEIYELVKEEEGITKIIQRDVDSFIPKRKSIY